MNLESPGVVKGGFSLKDSVDVDDARSHVLAGPTRIVGGVTTDIKADIADLSSIAPAAQNRDVHSIREITCSGLGRECLEIVLVNRISVAWALSFPRGASHCLRTMAERV